MTFLPTVFAKGFTSVSINMVVLALCDFVPNERVFIIHLRINRALNFLTQFC